MIKTVIFDIDGTMYDYTTGNRRGLEAVKDYCLNHAGITGEMFMPAMAKAGKRLEERLGKDNAAIHNRLLRYQCMLELLDKPVFPHALAMSDSYWGTLLEGMSPQPGLLEFMEDVKRRGKGIGVATNMTAYMQYKKLEKLGAASYMDWLVTSEEAGTEKPSPGFYEICLEKAGCRASECLFIGDSLNGDVQAPKESGMHALWYCPAETPGENGTHSHRFIRSFEECMEETFWKNFEEE
ncbi:MAG: HAD family hydrolase [Lacrimispora sp.]|uniref:HAD family hydrolase n=1 Tax=Lacrimispora sp. TaxID=2719234 RepID=UPI0039E37873